MESIVEQVIEQLKRDGDVLDRLKLEYGHGHGSISGMILAKDETHSDRYTIWRFYVNTTEVEGDIRYDVYVTETWGSSKQTLEYCMERF